MAFLEAFEKTGGIDGLIVWIKKDNLNRKEFYKMILSFLPKEKAEDYAEKVQHIVYVRNQYLPKPGDGGVPNG